MGLEFRLLRADEIECRIATVNQKGISLLLYKDARCDIRILNETVGAMNWEKRYSRDNANCTVSIWNSEERMWISKEDVGTESYTEKEKGLASDSFKRACFSWGLGIELYTSPFIWIPAGQLKTLEQVNGKWTCRDIFEVTHISYDDNRKIESVSILNVKTGTEHTFKNKKAIARNKAEENTAETETKFTKEFMQINGNKCITQRECDRLREACLKAGGNMTIDKALIACKKQKPEEITFTQYLALMANLKAVA